MGTQIDDLQCVLLILYLFVYVLRPYISTYLSTCQQYFTLIYQLCVLAQVLLHIFIQFPQKEQNDNLGKENHRSTDRYYLMIVKMNAAGYTKSILKMGDYL